MLDSPLGMNWPGIREYNAVIQHTASAFQDQDLQNGVVKLNAHGTPMSRSGKYASVFKITKGTKISAVKCFTDPITEQGQMEQEQKYAKLCDYLEPRIKQLPIRRFKYIKQGIWVYGKPYPIVKMDWDDGKTLDSFIKENFENSRKIKILTENWLDVIEKLRKAQIAHGDLQHGNIQVTQAGDIALVDYDCMYIPDFKKDESPEKGHENYRHPERNKQFYEGLDNFSSLVIYISLLALSEDPTLWGKYHIDDENLILKNSDFECPEQSDCFKQLKSSTNNTVSMLAVKLVRFCTLPIEQTPPLNELIQNDLCARRDTDSQNVKTNTAIPDSTPGEEYQSPSDCAVGDWVRHAEFGDGVVVSTAPGYWGMEATVDFKASGRKILALDIARFQKTRFFKGQRGTSSKNIELSAELYPEGKRGTSSKNAELSAELYPERIRTDSIIFRLYAASVGLLGALFLGIGLLPVLLNSSNQFIIKLWWSSIWSVGDLSDYLRGAIVTITATLIPGGLLGIFLTPFKRRIGIWFIFIGGISGLALLGSLWSGVLDGSLKIITAMSFGGINSHLHVGFYGVIPTTFSHNLTIIKQISQFGWLKLSLVGFGIWFIGTLPFLRRRNHKS